MSIDQLLDDVQDELAALWGSGVALPGPDRAGALRALADRTEGVGLTWAASRLRALAGTLPDPATSSGSAEEAYAHLQIIAAWVRTFRWGWALQRARERLNAGPEGAAAQPRARSGFDGVVSPVGVEGLGDRWTTYAVDATGRVVTLVDDVGEVSDVEPFRSPVSSALFQDRVDYGALLAQDLRFTDHPTTERGGWTVFAPCFYTRPESVPAHTDVVARLPGGRLTPGKLHRLPLAIRRRGEGWGFEHDGGDVEIAVSRVLSFNLAKRTAIDATPLEAVLLGRTEGASLIAGRDPLGQRVFSRC